MKNIQTVRTLAATITTVGLLAGGVNAAESIAQKSDSDWLSGDRFGIGAYGGTSGLGAHITYDVSKWLYIKGQLGGLSYDLNEKIDGIDYDGDLSLFSGGITANILPFHKQPIVNGFRISLGLFSVDNKLGIEASSPGQSIDLGNAQSFTLGANDRLIGESSFSSLAPYAGLGWDWNFGEEDQFTLSVDAGVLFVGEPDVNLRTVGTFADFAAQNSGLNLQNEVNSEVAALRRDAKEYQYYPVISLGFTWRF